MLLYLNYINAYRRAGSPAVLEDTPVLNQGFNACNLLFLCQEQRGMLECRINPFSMMEYLQLSYEE